MKYLFSSFLLLFFFHLGWELFCTDTEKNWVYSRSRHRHCKSVSEAKRSQHLFKSPHESFPALKKRRWGRCSWSSLWPAEHWRQQTQKTRTAGTCPSGRSQWSAIRPPVLRLDSSGETSCPFSWYLYTVKPLVSTKEVATVSFPSRPCSLLFSRITSQINHFHTNPFLQLTSPEDSKLRVDN